MASIGRQNGWRALSAFVAEGDRDLLSTLTECSIIDNHRPVTAVPPCGLCGPLMYQRLILTSQAPAPSTAQVTQTVLRRLSSSKRNGGVPTTRALEGMICVLALAVSDELAAVALLILTSLNAKYETPKFPVFVDPQSPAPPSMTISAISYTIAAHAETLSREIMSLLYTSAPQQGSRRTSLSRRVSRAGGGGPHTEAVLPPLFVGAHQSLLAGPPRQVTRPQLSPTHAPPAAAAGRIPSSSLPFTTSHPHTDDCNPSSCGIFAGLRRRFHRNTRPPKASLSADASSTRKPSTNVIATTTKSVRNIPISPPAARAGVGPLPFRSGIDSACVSQCGSADSLGELADFGPQMRRTRAVTEEFLALSALPSRPSKPRERRRTSGVEETDMEREDRYYSLCVETIISIASAIAFARQCGALAVVLRLDSPSGTLRKSSRLDALERALSLWLLNSQGPDLGLPCLFAAQSATPPGAAKVLITPTRLRRGDHIYRQIRSQGGLSILTHHGIYLGHGEVIHFTGNEHSLKSLLTPCDQNTSLRKATILDFMRYGGQLYIERYERPDRLNPTGDSLRYERGWPGRNGMSSSIKNDHDENAARRAELAYAYFHWKRQEERMETPADIRMKAIVQNLAPDLEFPPYNLLSNNCEHFCRWCKTGTAGSMQADIFGAAVDAFVRGFARQKSS